MYFVDLYLLHCIYLLLINREEQGMAQVPDHRSRQISLKYKLGQEHFTCTDAHGSTQAGW